MKLTTFSNKIVIYRMITFTEIYSLIKLLLDYKEYCRTQKKCKN